MMQSSSKTLLRRASSRSGIIVRSKSTRVEPSIVDTASDYFAALRWRAATALTSSLNSQEREQLLQKLDAVPKAAQQQEDEESVQTKSIGEAVAAARAEEAKRQESKWQREQNSLLKQAEEAAKARVESDLRIQERRIALERWTRDLEKEKEQDAMHTGDVQEATTQPGDDAHPVLGEALVDLGYKRVHVVSAKELSSIPIWKKQRIYRHARAKVMATDKVKTAELGLPGIIALHEDKNGKLSILDGQHRVGMMAILEEKQAEGFDLQRVLVEVFPHDDESSFGAEDIFLEINKAEPVKLVDMPGVARQSDRRIITDAAARLEEKFPEMFKASQKCRAPHVNIDNLRDALFASNVLKRHSLTSQKSLVSWIMEQNEQLKAKLELEGSKSVSETALKKAVKHNFFLGLESSWLYN